MPDQLVSVINTQFPQANAQVLKGDAGDSFIKIEKESIKKVSEFLKQHPENKFETLQVITGCDYPPDRIEVSYVLASYERNDEIILKVSLDRNNPELESVTSVWKSANFQERECYDMVGVKFRGHPDHRRILCPDDWEGFPLRKDYTAAKFYRGMEVYPEDKMNFPDREFAEKQKIADRMAKKAIQEQGK